MPSIAILGRQPELGITEAECLFSADALRLLRPAASASPPASAPNGHLAPIAVYISREPSDIPFKRLGGSVKLAKVLTRLDTNNWGEIERYLVKTIPEHLKYLPETGKFKLGLSVYGLKIRVDRLNATGLTLKKIIKATGRSVRIVPNKTADLNAAQVLHNQLTGNELGWELVLVADGTGTYLAQTTDVQDIEAYTKRDHGRPMRDPKVGMLPPKLAQIMINLAGRPTTISHGSSKTAISPESAATERQPRLLDPFCGTGVVLQEASLMGYAVYGTDLEERMIRFTRDNLNWLQDTMQINLDWFVETGDAAKHAWQKPIDLVVGETYLGRPLASLPDSGSLEKIIAFCDALHRAFFKNLANQLEPGIRLCMAVPAWQLRPGVFKHLPILDQMGVLGYNRISFVHVGTRDLIYARPDQVVARELVILEKQ